MPIGSALDSGKVVEITVGFFSTTDSTTTVNEGSMFSSSDTTLTVIAGGVFAVNDHQYRGALCGSVGVGARCGGIHRSSG